MHFPLALGRAQKNGGYHSLPPHGYRYENVPATIFRLLGCQQEPLPAQALHSDYIPNSCVLAADTPRTVITLFLDAFGWQHLAQHADHPLIQLFCQQGQLAAVVSQFPSTTAAHVTTMHTGYPLGQSGVPHWSFFSSTAGKLIAPLLMSDFGLGASQRNSSFQLEPEQILPPDTIYQRLARYGVRSSVIQPESFFDSPYNRWVTRGAESLGFSTFSDGMRSILQAVERASSVNKSEYIHLYTDEIDRCSHLKGPESLEVSETISALLDDVWNCLVLPLQSQNLSQSTILTIVADHGHASIKPETIVYLDKELPDLMEKLCVDSSGHPLAPVGSPRSLFLHVKESVLAAVEQDLRTLLEGTAEIVTVERLVEKSLLPSLFRGGEREPLGNLCVLPNAPYAVFFSLAGRHELNHYGSHGGLSREEMEIPFCCVELVSGFRS